MLERLIADTSTEKSASWIRACFGGVDNSGVQVRDDRAETVLNRTQVSLEVDHFGQGCVRLPAGRRLPQR